MAIIERSDLTYDYSWDKKPGHNPRFEGNPDSSLFDREAGRDVLYIINNYAEENNIRDKKDAREMERLLHEKMSKDVSTQRDVKDWLDSIWKNR